MRICAIDDRWVVEDPETEGYFLLAQELCDPMNLNLAAKKVADPACTFILDNGVYEQELVPIGKLLEIFGYLDAANNGILVSPDRLEDSFEVTVRTYKRVCDVVDPKSVMLVPHSPPGEVGKLLHAFATARDLKANWVGVSILSAPIAFAHGTYIGRYKLGKECREQCRSMLLAHLEAAAILSALPNLHLLGLGGDYEYVRSYAAKYPNIRSIDTHKISEAAARISPPFEYCNALHSAAVTLRREMEVGDGHES